MGDYQGYRLKLGNVVFPNTYIKKGTWNCNLSKKMITSYYDGNGQLHEEYYSDKKVNISFEVCEHLLEKHVDIIPFFEEKENVPVEYWDDDSCSYKTATCKISDITWMHNFSVWNNIFYASAKVSITEY